MPVLTNDYTQQKQNFNSHTMAFYNPKNYRASFSKKKKKKKKKEEEEEEEEEEERKKETTVHLSASKHNHTIIPHMRGPL